MATTTAAPIRRHPDCDLFVCQECLQDHIDLSLYLHARLGASVDRDVLSEYRQWLEENGIPAEKYGWASCEAFDPQVIESFVTEEIEGGEEADADE